MSVNPTPEPVDDAALMALFEQVELPPGLEAQWRARAAAPDKGRRAARRLRFGTWLQPASPWLRAAAAAAAAVVAVGVVAVVTVNRPPSNKPDPDVIHTITDDPPTRSSAPPTSNSQPQSSALAAPTWPGAPPPSGRGTGAPAAAPPPAKPNATNAPPARGPLAEWPDSNNTGVPAGTNLQPMVPGDLYVKAAGAIIADARVDGVIYVEAPDVILRRVHGTAGVVQRAPRLTIEDSEFSGGPQTGVGVEQEAEGLTVRRSDIYGFTAGVRVCGSATLVDNYVHETAERAVVAWGTCAGGVVIRHNTIASPVTVSGPITDVTIENNLLGRGDGVAIYAPTDSESRHIRVLSNQFRRDGANPAPVSGWNGQAPGNTWTGNVWFGTSEPVNP